MNAVNSSCLKDFDGSRKNNFTLLRVLFAWLVLYGHSYAIQNGAGFVDPLNSIFKGSIWIGELAVNGFFAVSGFLVTASIIKRGFFDYAVSRIIRIYPALILCVFFSVFVLGVIATSQSTITYLTSEDSYRYLTNSLAFLPMQWTLPGVFEQNTRDAVNGSLWSLPVELRCYMLLGIAGVMGVFSHRVTANFVALVVLGFGLFFFSDLPLIGGLFDAEHPALYFLLGVLFFVNREYVMLNAKVAVVCLLIGLSAFGKDWYGFIFPLCFVYLCFYAVYATPYVPVDDKLGDVSFGIYIYAWPVQQYVAQIYPEGNVYTNILLSTLVVLVLAKISWHYIESPILNNKTLILERSRKVLDGLAKGKKLFQV